MPERIVVVVAGGPPPDLSWASKLPREAIVLAADEGLEHAASLGLEVDEAIGDFDSVSPAALASAEARGIRVERHPAQKDATDLELALDRVLALGARRALVVAGEGGRFDHLLAGALLLGAERYAALQLDALVGGAQLHVVRGERELAGEPGELVSLVALSRPAEGITTSGLQYPLRGETLVPGSTRGVSNAFVEERARIGVERGVILAVRPGEAFR